MQFYIWIAVAGYLAFAVNSVIDKFLLKKSIPEPATYAFYIGLLSGLAIILAPFGWVWPSLKIIALALVSGASFVWALILFFEALKLNETSRVLPAIGAMVPIITFFLSWFIVGERLSQREIIGLIILIIGTLFIMMPNKRHGGYKWFYCSAGAAVLFALSFTLAKAVYLDIPFLAGLVWTRLGMMAAALSLLFFKSVRVKIFETSRKVESGSRVLFLSGQALAAAGGILQNYAVSLGRVTLVNALQGTQFAFLFLLTWFLSEKYPTVLREDYSRPALLKKIFSIILISAGLFFIA